MTAYRSENFTWAVELSEKKSFVLHTDTGVIGRVKRFWSGQGDDIIRTDARFPVIELENGHVLTAIEQNFTPLNDDEAQFYDIATGVLAHALKETIKLAASSGGKVSLATATVIVEAVLLAQYRALQPKKT